MQQIIHSERRAVSIYANDERGPFTARLYVNCEGGQLGDVTLTVAKRKSLDGAVKWAKKVLAQ